MPSTHRGGVDVKVARRVFASKHECSATASKLGREMADEVEALRRALGQACMNLATIRPLDMMEPGEDLSLGECRDRWQALVMEQTRA